MAETAGAPIRWPGCIATTTAIRLLLLIYMTTATVIIGLYRLAPSPRLREAGECTYSSPFLDPRIFQPPS